MRDLPGKNLEIAPGHATGGLGGAGSLAMGLARVWAPYHRPLGPPGPVSVFDLLPGSCLPGSWVVMRWTLPRSDAGPGATPSVRGPETLET